MQSKISITGQPSFLGNGERMNATHYFSRVIVTFVRVSAPIVTMWLALSGFAQENAGKPQERIGVYDSRAVAVAYAGSTFQQAKMKELKTQFKKAKEAGDAKEVSRLEAEGEAWQMNLNKQGFTTAPVDDLLVHIAGELQKSRRMPASPGSSPDGTRPNSRNTRKPRKSMSRCGWLMRFIPTRSSGSAP